MSDANLTPKSVLPARLAVVVCYLDGADNLYPVARFHKRQDGHWLAVSGASKAALCLGELEGAHECCRQAAVQQAANQAIAAIEQRTLSKT
jgi:hypothetical protein